MSQFFKKCLKGIYLDIVVASGGGEPWSWGQSFEGHYFLPFMLLFLLSLYLVHVLLRLVPKKLVK